MHMISAKARNSCKNQFAQIFVNEVHCKISVFCCVVDEFKIPLNRYLNTRPFYSVDEFLMFKNDSVLLSAVCNGFRETFEFCVRTTLHIFCIKLFL